jgi:hypothetical protein
MAASRRRNWRRRNFAHAVMAGLDPAIHVFLGQAKTWMPGTRPGMTNSDNPARKYKLVNTKKGRIIDPALRFIVV